MQGIKSAKEEMTSPFGGLDFSAFALPAKQQNKNKNVDKKKKVEKKLVVCNEKPCSRNKSSSSSKSSKRTKLEDSSVDFDLTATPATATKDAQRNRMVRLLASKLRPSSSSSTSSNDDHPITAEKTVADDVHDDFLSDEDHDDATRLDSATAVATASSSSPTATILATSLSLVVAQEIEKALWATTTTTGAPSYYQQLGRSIIMECMSNAKLVQRLLDRSLTPTALLQTLQDGNTLALATTELQAQREKYERISLNNRVLESPVRFAASSFVCSECHGKTTEYVELRQVKPCAKNDTWGSKDYISATPIRIYCLTCHHDWISELV